MTTEPPHPADADAPVSPDDAATIRRDESTAATDAFSADHREPVVVLTGGTSGIGRVAVERLAARGATVACIGRDREAGRAAERAASDLPGTIRFHRADLQNQSAVCDLAAELRTTYDRLDVLAHNAGLSSRTRRETADGLERTFAVNHLAPYLLTHELVDALRESAPARVVVTASDVHHRGTLAFEDRQYTADYDGLAAYARSKLANVAFTLELADRLDPERVVANCLHPGFVPSTRLFRDAAPWVRLGLRVLSVVPGVGTSPETGADRLLRLATAPEYATRTGVYLANTEARPASMARDPDVRRELWTQSAALVDVDPDWP